MKAIIEFRAQLIGIIAVLIIVLALPVEAAATTFSNTAAISIPSGPGPASPNPSIITVTGITGSITKVTVTLNGLSHTFPDDISVMVVAPGLQGVVLMSNAGGDSDLTNVDLTFDDAAGASLPENGSISSGTYKPSYYNSAMFYSIRPFPTPISTNLGLFNGLSDTSVNGDWKLYISDDSAANSGSISGGWSLTLTYNSVPVANNDAYSTNEDTPLTITASGVLSNDTDADSDSLTTTVVDGPSNGSLTLNSDGSFTYTPNANFNGTDSFTYRANDGTVNSNTATVTLTVNAVNDAPVANWNVFYAFEDTPLTNAAPGVLSDDTDVDADTLTAVLESGPSHGSLTLNADGSFTYTPDADFDGTDSFTYHANDGTADSNSITESIYINPVNDPPVANDDAFFGNEDIIFTAAAPGVLGNDTNIEGSQLDWEVVTWPSHGTVLSLQPNGVFAYNPHADFNGIDSFTYRAFDRDGSMAFSNVATVTLTINGAPVAGDDAYSTNQNTPLTVPASGVLGNDTDIEASPLTAAVVNMPGNGSLTLNLDGSFTYTPNPNFNGTDSFTYAANDGAINSNFATVTLTVNAAPVASNDAYSTNEDTSLSIAAAGVLSNDTDAESNPLTATLLTAPGNGSLVFNSNGAFTYTPNANFNGTDSFTYQANDGAVNSNTATVILTVNAVNDAPVATDDAYSTNEDTLLSIAAPGVLGNDSDADGDPLSAVLVTGVSNGSLTLNADGSFDYTPHANFNGSDSFTYLVNDGTTTSNTVTVSLTVNAVDDAPVAGDDSYSTPFNTSLTIAAPGVLGNDTDTESSALTAALVTGPSNGSLTFNADGSFTYTPNTGFSGADSFTYQANDGTSSSNTATVSLSVGVNTAPVATAESYTTPANTALTIAAPGVLGNDFDIDNDPLTAVLVTGTANGTLTLNADGSFTYTPNAGFSGIDIFTYQANDGTVNSNRATVQIGVDALPQVVELPAPPPAPACTDVNLDKPGMIRTHFTNDADRVGLNCRLLAANGHYMTWLGGPITFAENVGNQTVLDLGVIAAVDVFKPGDQSGFAGDVVVCLKGSGHMIYLNAQGQPRVPQLWSTWTTDAFPGYTCTTLYTPGTVILVQKHP